MAGVKQTASAKVSAVVEFEGHLIDSLTLARVMDLIEELHGEYQLNYLHIAKSKANVSKAILTLFKSSQGELDELLGQLLPYGIRVLSQESAVLQPTEPLASQVPIATEAAFRLHLPKQIRIEGKNLPITLDPSANNDSEWVIAVSSQKTSARLTSRDRLNEDELLVCGYQGLCWS
ncbi:MAG: hypothetical protein VKJ04_03130 [Vampirovibrionales bacterium]|nr:hypothetical protein [Vampirovibrionales bacterium]